MKPNKLKIGDEIRVIAPSRSMCIIGQDTIDIAKARLEDLGFKVSFGKNVMNKEDDNFLCASIEDRISDLHEAFLDENVKCILTIIGGFNVNQLLDYIDYDIIKSNPKILCGFSDITALSNAIYAKTGLINYSGVHFSSLGMKKGCEYSLEYFKKMCIEEKDVTLEDSSEWSNDLWFLNQDDREFMVNPGTKIINQGTAQGTIIGGNLNTLNLLQGTKYMPTANDCILFIEDSDKANFDKEFDRNLESLLQTDLGDKIRAVVIGRAELNSSMNDEKWEYIIRSKKKLENIPVISGVGFGHSTPMITFPIGGSAKVEAGEVAKVTIFN